MQTGAIGVKPRWAGVRAANAAIQNRFRVGSIPLTRKARIFIDTDRTFTGLAAVNPGNVDALVTYRLLDGNGFPIEVIEQPLPAHQHVAKLAGELFDLPARFSGLLEIESDVDLVPITLKLSVNARGDSILTTLPIADLVHPDNSSRVTFPQVGSGSAEGVGEFSTRLIFIEPTGAAAAEGQLRFWKGQGDPLRLDRIAASVDFGVEAGAAGEINFTDLPPPPEVSRGQKTSKQVGPEGGLLLLQDDLENLLLLEIPAFALEEPVTVTMTALTEKPARSLGQNLFPGVVLEPEGLILQESARLTVLLSRPLLHPERAALLYVDPYGSHRPLPKPLAAGQVVEGDISHFSPFTIGESNLTDLLAAAHSIYAQTDSVLKERLRRYYENEYGAQFPDELLQILVRLDDIKTLELYNGSLEALGQAASPDFKGFVEETVLEILSGSLPSDPCGLYQVALNYLLRLVPILNDPALEASFRSRLAQVDTKCISDSLAGDWLEESNTQNETCHYSTVAGLFEFEEEDETGLNPFRIEQNGSRLEIRYTSISSSPTFHGEVRKTTSPSNPYRVTASYDGSSSLDCLTFFSSGGHDLDFGAPLCFEYESCTPLSCSESLVVGASVQLGGNRLAGVESWTFGASVRVNPPDEPAYIRSISCRGGGPFSAVKTH